MSATLTPATESAGLPHSTVQPAVLVRTSDEGVTFRQRFTPKTANLQFLNCGEFSLPAASESQSYSLPRNESLLFQWEGSSTVTVDGNAFILATYDTLYIPRAAEFTIANPSGEPAKVIQTSAPAAKAHPVHHSSWKDISRNEARIRHLKGKDVFMMFDVTEPAEKLVAGYTFFQPHQRSWPPHNHTDQEEVYIFINGNGAMEVYETPETLSFVHSVNRGDMVTIPFLNYHPVFSQESPLEFIWCIAGERYWVGDKNKDFLAGKGDSITT